MADQESQQGGVADGDAGLGLQQPVLLGMEREVFRLERAHVVVRGQLFEDARDVVAVFDADEHVGRLAGLHDDRQQIAGGRFRSEDVRAGERLEAFDEADDANRLVVDLGRVADAGELQAVLLGDVHDDAAGFGQRPQQFGGEFLVRADGVGLEVGADDDAQLGALAGLGPVGERLVIRLDLGDARERGDSADERHWDRPAEIDRQNAGRTDPDVGPRIVDGDGRDREQAEQEPALEGHEDGAKAHGEDAWEVARLVVPDARQCVIHGCLPVSDPGWGVGWGSPSPHSSYCIRDGRLDKSPEMYR